jgi:hypothetical protein
LFVYPKLNKIVKITTNKLFIIFFNDMAVFIYCTNITEKINFCCA